MSHTTLDRRTFLRYSGTAAVAAALAGCDTDGDGEDTPTPEPPTPTPTDGVHITVAQRRVPESLDPLLDTSPSTHNVIDQCYDPLLERDEDGRPRDRIVTGWEREDDRTIRLEIREDVTFHSGNELGPQDVAYSIRRANDPEVSEVASVIGDIREVTVEEGDVLLELGTSEPVIFRRLAAFGRVLEQEWVEEREGAIDFEMNGTGPYDLLAFEPGEEVVFDRFEGYWGELPEIDRGTITADAESYNRLNRLLDQEVDIAVGLPPEDIAAMEDTAGVSPESGPSVNSVFVVMNDVHQPFDDQAFRQAMNYAVDVDAVVEEGLAGLGEPVGQPTLPGHTGYNPDVEPYPYDPERAEDLVADSGYDGVELTLHTPVGQYVNDAEIAEMIAGQIDDLANVSCAVEYRVFRELIGQIFEPQADSPAFFLFRWHNPIFDATHTMVPFFSEGVFQHFTDEDLEVLLGRAASTTDESDRTATLQEANALANELAPWVFLYQEYGVYGTTDRITWSSRPDESVRFEHVAADE